MNHFLIFIIPSDAINIPRPKTEENSTNIRVCSSSALIERTTAEPSIIKAPPNVIKTPNPFDFCFLVAKNDTISMSEDIPPNIVPLIEALSGINPIFSLPAAMTSTPYIKSKAMEIIDIATAIFSIMVLADSIIANKLLLRNHAHQFIIFNIKIRNSFNTIYSLLAVLTRQNIGKSTNRFVMSEIFKFFVY